MGIGIKFDGSFVRSDTSIINSIVHKLRSALNKRNIQIINEWVLQPKRVYLVL